MQEELPLPSNRQAVHRWGRGERRLPSPGQEQGCQSEGGTGWKKGERMDLGLDLLHLRYHLSNLMEKGKRVQMAQWC